MEYTRELRINNVCALYRTISSPKMNKNQPEEQGVVLPSLKECIDVKIQQTFGGSDIVKYILKSKLELYITKLANVG